MEGRGEVVAANKLEVVLLVDHLGLFDVEFRSLVRVLGVGVRGLRVGGGIGAGVGGRGIARGGGVFCRLWED